MARVHLDRREVETGDLPPICMSCGAPATEYTRMPFVWYPMLAAGIPLWRMMSQRRVNAIIPTCPSHRRVPLLAMRKLWGLRAVEITPESVVFEGVADEFGEALHQHRAGRRSGIAVVDLRFQREPLERPLMTPPPSSGGGGWIVAVVLLCVFLPLLLLGGLFLVFVILMKTRSVPPPVAVGPRQAAPGPPIAPPPVGPAPAAPARAEQVGLLAACPVAPFPAAVPWAALAVAVNPDLPRPLADAELNGLLVDVQRGDVFRAEQAAKKLAKAWPTEPGRAEVGRALEKALTHRFPQVRQAAAEALVVWGAKENVPALTQALQKEPFPHVRKPMSEALTAIAARK
jgi:hypothetical protein